LNNGAQRQFVKKPQLQYKYTQNVNRDKRVPSAGTDADSEPQPIVSTSRPALQQYLCWA